MNIREISEALHINRNSVAKYLDVLTTREEVEFKFFGKSKVYFLSQRVPVAKLIGFSSHLMVILNRDLCVVQINDAFLHYLDQPRETVTGASIAEIGCELFANDTVRDWCTEALLGNEITNEISIPVDGARHYFRAVLTPTRFPDNSAGIICFFENITEKKQIKSALLESEEKFRSFVENANEIIFSLTPVGFFTYVSPTVTELLGHDPAELIGKNAADIIHPDDFPRNREVFLQSLSTGKKMAGTEFRLRHKDGTWRWHSQSVSPVRDTDGRVVAIQGTCHDITKRMEAERAIRESEERFRHLIDYVPGLAVQGYYLDGTTFYWNGASERLYGYTAEEAIGRNLLDLIIPPEMREGVKAAIAGMAASGQPVPSADLSLMRKDGSRVEVYSGHAIVTTMGNPPQLFCMDIDLTERRRAERAIRESEDRFQQVAENAGEWIWEVDAEGVYRYSSAAVERILGYRPDEIVGRMHYYDLSPPEVRDEFRRMTIEAIARGEPFRGFIHPALHKEGRTVVLETSATAAYDNGGTFIGYRGCDTDITERRELEIARQEALDQIEKNIGQLAMLGDHIRNPLTAILAYAGLMAPEAEEKIAAQVAEIDRIIGRIDQQWIESEKVRSFLRKHYAISLPGKPAPDPDIHPGTGSYEDRSS